ncbi:zinc finger C3HC-type protein 1-like [Mytilus californianus]|uniref:zinc finger C3HC-type protein 1-like n=1 Tax=Mytilus californianus TaxID=6549 RepID=UPI00224813AB|nr:zinc finger C3HC-type protein 1-like [Mytilus californianus]
METIDTATPDKKLKNLLSSFISKPKYEQSSKRKRSFTEELTETSVAASHDKEIPQCAPSGEKRKNVDSQDEEAFFERVESYDMMSWFAKPLDLSPLICSRYGWKNKETDMLQCVGCKAVLCGQLPKRANSLIYHESCMKLKDNLRNAHLKSCFWPAYPSPERYSYIPIKDRKKLVCCIKEYIDSLQKVQGRLPEISLKSFEEKGLSANHLEEMKCTAEKHLENHNLDNIDLGTFSMAITGWKVSDPKTGLIVCHFCRRKVGLWNYACKNAEDSYIDDSVSSEESDVEATNSTKTNGIKVDEISSKTDSKSSSDEEVATGTNGNSADDQPIVSHQGDQQSLESGFNFSQPNFLDPSASSELQPLLFDDNQYIFSQPSCVVKDLNHVNEMDTYESSLGDTNVKCNSENKESPVKTDLGSPAKAESVETLSCEKLDGDNEKCKDSYSVDDALTLKSTGQTNQDSISLRNNLSAQNDGQCPVQDTESQPRRKKLKIVKKDHFNPLEEHRYWCPWINKLPEQISYSPQKISEVSQSEGGKTSYPWEHVLQVICPSFFDVPQEDSMSEHFKQHSPVAGLRQLRKLMKDWSN